MTLPLETPVEAAWSAYRDHRFKEATRPELADDRFHRAETRRLYDAFLALYDGDESRSNVVEFRRLG